MKIPTRSPLHRLGFLLAAALVLTGCMDRPIPVPTEAGAPCSDQTFEGFPRLEPQMGDSFFVCHSGFALQYAPPLRSALWVTQRLDGFAVDDNTVSRDGEYFRADAVLPKGLTPPPDRFVQTGYDRGHLAPAADFQENPAGMSHSFYTSNIVPQNPDNNRGVWARLERNVRAWARQKGTLYVVTGPIYYAGGNPFQPVGWLVVDEGENFVIKEYNPEDSSETPEQKRRRLENDPKAREEEERRRSVEGIKASSPTKIAIPSHLYKVIYDPAANTAIAFVVPNINVPESNLAQYATTVAEVERLTALRFFPNLSFEAQGELKTQVSPRSWLLGL